MMRITRCVLLLCTSVPIVATAFNTRGSAKDGDEHTHNQWQQHQQRENREHELEHDLGGRDLASCFTCDTSPCVPGGPDFYFRHCDPKKFVQCDNFGSCFERPCAPGTNWDDPISTCNFPVSPQLLSYQETPGVCTNSFNGVGCNLGGGTSGNPNDLVNCFFAPYTPLEVTDIQFWLDDDPTPLPDTLSVRVWSGSVADGPEEVLAEQTIAPVDIVGDLNTVALDSPVLITEDEFCVGVFSAPLDDAFRLQTESFEEEVSFSLAPTCLVDPFTTLQTIGLDGVFCIETTVRQA